MLFLPTIDGLVPGLEVGLTEAFLGQSRPACQSMLGLGVDGVIGKFIFVMLRAIDVDVDNRSFGGELLDGSCNSVIEAGPDANQQVALTDRPIACNRTMHPVPIQRLWVVSRECSETH